MKKVMSVLVVLSLLFTVCIPAFAGANVDALNDAQQKQVASLVLASAEKGNDIETIGGRNAVKRDVISGISDFSAYKDAYDNDPASIKELVSQAVAAVKEDVGFSDSSAAMLTTLLTGAIIDTIYPVETTTGEDTTADKGPEMTDDLQQYVDILSKLNANQMQSVLVTLVGNNVITADEATAIINQLYKDRVITTAEKEALLEAIVSDDATTNVFEDIFEGYTPSDLAQLFRGFGDSIETITSALANLFRGDSSDDGSSSGGSSSGSNTENPSDIPATGDYAIPAVAAVALAAGAALLLTRKKTGNDD